MGIFLEEVMNQSNVNNSVNIDDIVSEHAELVLEHNELLSEMADSLIEMLNEECIFTESVFDDLKVKKEDLADPNKVKAIIKRLDKEHIAPDKKALMLNSLYIFLMALVSVLPGFTIAIIGIKMGNDLFWAVGLLIELIGPRIVGANLDRYNSFISKTQKSIKKVEKKLKKEKDPQNIKALKSQLNALQKNLKLFEDESYRVKKEINKKS